MVNIRGLINAAYIVGLFLHDWNPFYQVSISKGRGTWHDLTGAQAWLAAGVYELGEFIQDRFKAVLPPKYLVRMDHIAHRRQLKDRKRAPKEIEVNGEMMPWNRFEVQQGNEDTKGNGEEEETTNLSKAKENKGTAARRQATKRKTHENEEEEDSKQDVKKIKVKAKEEEVGHGEEETAWKQVQKAKGHRKAQGKSESRLQALQALQALQGSGREDESSKKDGKEFRGKGNGEEEDQKEPVEKAEDAKDKQARAEKAATKEAKEAAKQEARVGLFDPMTCHHQPCLFDLSKFLNITKHERRVPVF